MKTNLRKEYEKYKKNYIVFKAKQQSKGWNVDNMMVFGQFIGEYKRIETTQLAEKAKKKRVNLSITKSILHSQVELEHSLTQARTLKSAFNKMVEDFGYTKPKGGFKLSDIQKGVYKKMEQDLSTLMSSQYEVLKDAGYTSTEIKDMFGNQYFGSN